MHIIGVSVILQQGVSFKVKEISQALKKPEDELKSFFQELGILINPVIENGVEELMIVSSSMGSKKEENDEAISESKSGKRSHRGRK